MNGRMERELPYTADDIALLREMRVAIERPSRKWLESIVVGALSALVTLGLIEAYIWVTGWYR